MEEHAKCYACFLLPQEVGTDKCGWYLLEVCKPKGATGDLIGLNRYKTVYYHEELAAITNNLNTSCESVESSNLGLARLAHERSPARQGSPVVSSVELGDGRQ